MHFVSEAKHMAYNSYLKVLTGSDLVSCVRTVQFISEGVDMVYCQDVMEDKLSIFEVHTWTWHG